MSEEKYYETVYDKLIDGVKFKFKKLNPVEHLSLCTGWQTWEKVNGSNYSALINKVLINVIFSKNDTDWFPLVDENGNSRLPEFEDNIWVGMDLFLEYKKKVINPVFTESKTIQNITSQKKKGTTN